MLSGSVSASSTVLPLNPPWRIGGSSGFAGGRDHPSLNPLAQDLARGMQPFPQHQPSVLHNRHLSYQGARSAPFEHQWYADVITRIGVNCSASKLPPPHFVQGRSRLLLHMLRKLRISSISPPLQGKASPCLYTARFLLSRIVFHSADAALQTNLPRARRKARHSPPLPLRGKTRQRCPFGTIYVGPIRSARFLDSAAAAPPLHQRTSLRRPDPPARMSWRCTSMQRSVPALESPSCHASTFIRPAPAAAIALPPMPFASVRLRVLRFAPDTQSASHKRHRPT